MAEAGPRSPEGISQELRFPDGFLWGAATSAHQVEGDNYNTDWWRSEERGLVPHRSGAACDQWRRYPDDVRLLRDLGLNAYRLSVEWARIEPEPGHFHQPALDHYRRVIEALREAGIEPVVTLHHFTNPIWLAERGAWSNPEVVPRLAAYAERVGRALGDLVQWWVTINEPSVFGTIGYLEGHWPPHHVDDLRGYQRHMRFCARGHIAARQALRASRGDALCSLAFALYPMQPRRPWNPQDRAAAHVYDWLRQGRMLRDTASTLDWVGVNYYFRILVRWDPRPWKLFARTAFGPGAKSDLGWEIYPTGLYEMLRRVGAGGKPVMITENGIADADDDQRPRYILAHLAQAHRAIRDGVDLRGYLHWSLLDNFEWAEGYAPRFGLVAVDGATQTRTPRRSAFLYRDIARANAVTRAMQDRADAD